MHEYMNAINENERTNEHWASQASIASNCQERQVCACVCVCVCARMLVRMCSIRVCNAASVWQVVSMNNDDDDDDDDDENTTSQAKRRCRYWL